MASRWGVWIEDKDVLRLPLNIVADLDVSALKFYTLQDLYTSALAKLSDPEQAPYAKKVIDLCLGEMSMRRRSYND